MPIPVPPPPRRPRGARRRDFRPRPTQNSRNEHSPIATEEIDRLASMVIDMDEPLEVMDEFMTLAALLSFATSTPQAVAPTFLDMTPTSTSTPGGGGDASYVPGAQSDRGSNPARSDLGGLAVNTYQLKMAVAESFGIKPGSIGGRSYRPYKSDHTTGHAIDIPGSGARGQVIADWVIARASTYKVKYIIFNHRIWYPGRGWQPYTPSASVRGFASDPYHERHVHVSTY